MENDGGDTERNRATKSTALAAPFKVPRTVVGFVERPTLAKPALCARLYGFSVNDCACKITAGWLECPPEARGQLEPIAEFRARAGIVLKPPPVAIPTAPIDNSGFSRSSLRAAKVAASAPPAPPRLVTDIEPEPNTPDQIRATVAAERATLVNGGPPGYRPQTIVAVPVGGKQPAIGGRQMGFTGNICSNCQSTRMVRNGVCETCLDCFHSGECG